MYSPIRPNLGTLSTSRLMVFVLGVLVLLGTWRILFWWESEFFTEPLLAGYYCCASEQDLPGAETLERTLSDFFHTSPGKHLPSLTMVTASAAVFLIAVRKARIDLWCVPFVFVLATVSYLLADFWLIMLSSSIRDSLAGPHIGPYQGYDRTWFMIVLHLTLWGVLLYTLVRASIKRES